MSSWSDTALHRGVFYIRLEYFYYYSEPVPPNPSIKVAFQLRGWFCLWGTPHSSGPEAPGQPPRGGVPPAPSGLAGGWCSGCPCPMPRGHLTPEGAHGTQSRPRSCRPEGSHPISPTPRAGPSSRVCCGRHLVARRGAGHPTPKAPGSSEGEVRTRLPLLKGAPLQVWPGSLAAQRARHLPLDPTVSLGLEHIRSRPTPRRCPPPPDRL